MQRSACHTGSIDTDIDAGTLARQTHHNRLRSLQDGRSSSLTAPHGPSQQAVIAAALGEAGLSPSDLAGLEMHGTGTPLGDPIEAGAAAAVLCTDRRPLQLSAAKALTGHAEPAAGTVGIVQAAAMLRQAHAAQLQHLRALNPHVASLFGDAKAQPLSMVMPRQPGGRVYPAGADALGVSAFAFQGTNAHAVLQSASGALESPASRQQSRPAWQRQRLWYCCQARAVVQRAVAVSGAQVSFQTLLSQPSLGFLLDHRIQGAALFPGASMFDMACSAAAALHSSWESSCGGLLAAAIAAPLVMQEGNATLLICNLGAASGRIEVGSQTGWPAARVHLTATCGEQPRASAVANLWSLSKIISPKP